MIDDNGVKVVVLGSLDPILMILDDDDFDVLDLMMAMILWLNHPAPPLFPFTTYQVQLNRLIQYLYLHRLKIG